MLATIHAFFAWYGWNALVAIGTLALAFGTGWLGWSAWREGSSVRQQVTLEREQMEAASVPLVYPHFDYDFAQGVGDYAIRGTSALLPAKNGGPGLALNVLGAIWPRLGPETQTTSIELHGGTIASGDVLDLRLGAALDAGWEGVLGFLEYEDMRGRKWATHFRFDHARGNHLVCFHEPPVLVEEAGDPRKRYPRPSIVA